MGAAAVVIKGGHFDGPTVVDLLFDGYAFTSSATPRIDRPQHTRHRLHVRVGDRRPSGPRPLPAGRVERAHGVRRRRDAARPCDRPRPRPARSFLDADANGVGPRGQASRSDLRTHAFDLQGPTLAARPHLYSEDGPAPAGGDTGGARPQALAASVSSASTHARRRGRHVSRPGAQPEHGPSRAIPGVRSVRAAGAYGHSRGSRTRAGRALAGRMIGCITGRDGSRSARRVSRSPSRRRIARDAFVACRYAIERVKQIAPIWKHEYFDGGEVWIEGATADPDDEAREVRGVAAIVRVTVRLFARLREMAGASELERDGRCAGDDRQRVGGAGATRFRRSRRTAVDFGRAQSRVRASGRAGRGRRRNRVPAAGLWRAAANASSGEDPV